MNNFLFDIENTRVPILLIGLSERSLLEGDRKLITVRATDCTCHREASGKQKKEKQRNLKMPMSSKSPLKCLLIILLYFSYVDSFVLLKDLTVQILIWLSNCSKLAFVSDCFCSKRFRCFYLVVYTMGTSWSFGWVNFSCNISPEAVHFDTHLMGKLECNSRTPMLFY